MGVSVFLSHNSEDKNFVRRLASDLETHNIKYWLDEAEIKIGESLIEKIRQGIDDVDYVAVVLSPNSISSPWVQREIDVAMNQEIQGKRIKVLPIMYKKCDLPGFLLGKLYADFTNEANYKESFKKLVGSIGMVFNNTAFEASFATPTLGYALNKAVLNNLQIYPKPFHRPFQYIGLTISEVSKEVGQLSNDVGNIIIDTEDCHMLLEAEGNFINYVEIEFKKTAPFYQNQEFDSEILLGALSISPSELDLHSKKTFSHTYYDHRRKLKINVLCAYDGGPLSIGFSPKYYGI